MTTSPDYTFPYGEDALTKFNDTQGTSFATSKITQGLTGVGMIGLGAVGLATGMFTGGAGAIAGVSTITTGLIQMTSSITSSIAKYNDLSKTPDTIQGMGGNFAHDIAHGFSLLPFIAYSQVNSSLRKMYYDYFYNYGYMVNRFCIFNELISDWSQVSGRDDDLFRREYFNFIKISEDIVDKINSDVIPPKAKEKISDIFKSGIKLWTFFHWSEYLGMNGSLPRNSKISDYYLKDYYENAEYER